jgi:hypothetical protein
VDPVYPAGTLPFIYFILSLFLGRTSTSLAAVLLSGGHHFLTAAQKCLKILPVGFRLKTLNLSFALVKKW